MNEMRIDLGEYGSSFATRDKARAIGRHVRESCPDQGSNIVIDFGKVRVVSYSFADQLFEEVVLVMCSWGHKHQLSFVNCRPEIIDVLETVFARRNKIEPSLPRADIYTDHIAFASVG